MLTIEINNNDYNEKCIFLKYKEENNNTNLILS